MTLWEFGECVSKADRRYRCFWFLSITIDLR